MATSTNGTLITEHIVRLPATGTDLGFWTWLGVGSIVLGGVAVLIIRRKRATS